MDFSYGFDNFFSIVLTWFLLSISLGYILFLILYLSPSWQASKSEVCLFCLHRKNNFPNTAEPESLPSCVRAFSSPHLELYSRWGSASCKWGHDFSMNTPTENDIRKRSNQWQVSLVPGFQFQITALFRSGRVARCQTVAAHSLQGTSVCVCVFISDYQLHHWNSLLYGLVSQYRNEEKLPYAFWTPRNITIAHQPTQVHSKRCAPCIMEGN